METLEWSLQTVCEAERMTLCNSSPASIRPARSQVNDFGLVRDSSGRKVKDRRCQTTSR